GCIMGSKNLKAIAARGTRGIKVHDPEGFLQVVRELFHLMDSNLARYSFKKNGTVGIADMYEQIGDLAYRNDQYCLTPRPKLDKLRASWAYEHVKRGDLSCSPGCTSGCGSWLTVRGDESPYAQRLRDTITAGPELYATVTFGMACDVPDFVAVTALNSLCNYYGIDGIEMGSLIPFLMELWERGIITERETEKWCGEPISFTWGNMAAIEKTIESVGLQNNDLGRLLQRGIVPAAQEIERLTEQPTLPYACYAKGEVAFQKEIRSFPSWAIGFAVSSRGADHLKGVNMVEKASREDISRAWLDGDPGAGKPFCPDRKGAVTAYAENRNAAINALGICCFRPVFDPLELNLNILARAFQALTGFEMTGARLYQVGERICNLEKAFNSRVGLRRQDDLLCQRWMKDPLPDGPGKGMKAEDYFETLLNEYYEFKGWDKSTALQTQDKLLELGLEEVAEVLVREKALST
ncbi:MAG: aldehyde ferredoxin oxidoreductase C-terminal domain-containing protein, partial [Candidatus Binatia bacterium]|nr:aldehyde ferredoxin oxidoreductase C-terminal domain-containing protein [Candidatus Binatia bacterium]